MRYSYGENLPPEETIIIKGLSSNLTEEAIKTAFSAYGQVNNVKIMDKYDASLLNSSIYNIYIIIIIDYKQT